MTFPLAFAFAVALTVATWVGFFGFMALFPDRHAPRAWSFQTVEVEA